MRGCVCCVTFVVVFCLIDVVGRCCYGCGVLLCFAVVRCCCVVLCCVVVCCVVLGPGVHLGVLCVLCCVVVACDGL